MTDDELAEEILRALTALGVSAWREPDVDFAITTQIGDSLYSIVVNSQFTDGTFVVGVQTVSQAIDAVEGWLAAEAPKPGMWDRFITWLTGW